MTALGIPPVPVPLPRDVAAAVAAAGARLGVFADRIQWFSEVTSTNDIVTTLAEAGNGEGVVVAADAQNAGRGRFGRDWASPHGAGIYASVLLRPPAAALRLVTIAAGVALADGIRAATGLTLQLKWPNDLVAIDSRSGDVRKLSGVLGETDGLGTKDARAVIGIGVNADWKPQDFPPDLATTMTSLAELAPGQVIDREVIVHVFLRRLAKATKQLRAGKFPAEAWRARQLTNGVPVRLEWPDGRTETVSAVDVDVDTGALLVGELGGGGGQKRTVLAGEIRHLRLGGIV